MTQIRTPELVNTKAETLFRQQVRGGIQVANQAHPYLATRGFYGSIDTITQMNIPDLAKATAALLLAIPNLARMLRVTVVMCLFAQQCTQPWAR